MRQRFFSPQALIIGIGALFIGLLFSYLVATGGITFNFLKGDTQTELSEAAFAKDIEALQNVEPGFAEIREFFVTLADEKGGVYAFEVLKRAPLPPNIDLHLLGHAVGDELYKQEGLDGMQHCTHELRNACSHSIVIGALLAEGLSVFDRVNEVCKKAPGGLGAYTMCFHGFGHGVLAYTEYEVPDAVELCKRVGTEEYHQEEYHQCIGGIVMEMHQGVHDPQLWEEKKEKYLSADDPLRLCQEAYMPEGAKVLCYSYITPYIFDAAGAVNGNPSPDIYPEAFAYCDEIEDDLHRKTCYAGFGKEFIVLAQDRDIREIEDMPDENMERAASWCLLAQRQEAQEACLVEILNSLYWGGENDADVSIRYCSLLDSDATKEACFEHLFEITSYYRPNEEEQAAICAAVPETYAQRCESVLLD